MNVYVLLSKFFSAELGDLWMSFDELIGYGGGLLHHVSQVACHCERSLSFGYGTLHEENLSAHLCPGQSRYHSYPLVAFLLVVQGSRESEIFLQVVALYALRNLLTHS